MGATLQNIYFGGEARQVNSRSAGSCERLSPTDAVRYQFSPGSPASFRTIDGHARRHHANVTQ
jgi:hypothetical protein